jgi:hypothetical protein
MPVLKKLPLDGPADLSPAKFSEMILEFAQPIFDLMGGLQTIEQLKSGLNIAVLAWNLPVFEQTKSPKLPEHRAVFEKMVASAPEEARVVIRQLLEDRKGRFGLVPTFVFVTVEGDTLDNARVVAEARMPREFDQTMN